MSETGRSAPRRAVVLIPLALLAFLVFGLSLERLPYFGEARDSLRGRSGPAGLPNDGAVGEAVAEAARRFGTDVTLGNPGSLPSTLVMQGRDLGGPLPVLSIAADEDALHDPGTGILANMRQTGRDWERLSWVSLWEDGELITGSRAGLRIHGDTSRYRGFPSFRLYFRPSYGTGPEIGGRLLGPDADPARSVVVHVVRRDGFYPNVFVFEIAARLGLPVSEFRPVRTFLNGDERGVYVLTERIMPDGWGRTHFGDDDFYMFVYKGETAPSSSAAHDDLQRWISATDGLTMTAAEERVDVENLTAHLFTLMFSFTTDWAQGAALFDRNEPDSRWFWIHWDMDQSFHRRGGSDLQDWEQPVMELITLDADLEALRARGIVTDELHTRRHMTDVRRLLFNKLLEDPEYERFFVRYVTDTLNHTLTVEFFADMLQRYAHLERQPGVYGNVNMDRYLRRRPEFMRRAVAEHFGLEAPVTVTISDDASLGYAVDGFAHRGAYTGRYFPGQRVRVELDDPATPQFRHWRVNGEPQDGTVIDVEVSGRTSIRLMARQ